MLRISTTTNDNKLTLKLDGRLVGPWVDELRKTVFTTDASTLSLEIDVSDLTYADDEGERALCWLYKMGAIFRGKGASHAEYLFQRLKIPFQPRQTELGEKGGHMPR